ncbi:MAG: GNAT family N-acetyltransferase [Cyanobacteria bacterium SID2]|nr:GNAT family N-acetyltransferase [Cyanobacteria bacterium SID2]MBP0002955.1 GNAT family N-acetyltransferase [Cyanobacteria bacterium SBC]
MDRSIQFSQLDDINSEDCSIALDIYEEAFPPEERVRRDKVIDRIAKGVYELWIGKDGDRVVFMTILYNLQQSDLVLLGYIATDAAYRNLGIGSTFLQDVLNHLKPLDRYLLIEMEHPDNDDGMARRRLEFYRRIGAKLLENVRYILPPLSGDRPTEMLLAIAPGYRTETLDRLRVRHLLTQLYVEAYDRSIEDPLLHLCLSSVPETVRLV